MNQVGCFIIRYKSQLGSQLLVDNGKMILMIISDLAQSVFIARRNDVTTNWEKIDYYSQGLAVIVRNDYQVIDEDACRFIELSAEEAPATK